MSKIRVGILIAVYLGRGLVPLRATAGFDPGLGTWHGTRTNLGLIPKGIPYGGLPLRVYPMGVYV